MTRQRLHILGATGSIGRSVRDVVLAHQDRFEVVSVVGGHDALALASIARELSARYAVVSDLTQKQALKLALEDTDIVCGAGESAIADAVAVDADCVIAAISGTAGLKPTSAAMKKGRRIALANKECLVTAGYAFMRDAKQMGIPILPVDSEHNALLQALGGEDMRDVVSLTLTASGGPFRTWSAQDINKAGPEQALSHPTWSMGAKISIDSASLMNKGLELIEARHLFDARPDQLDVVVHPQSIVHGLVNWRDGSVTAGLAPPDMRVPILHCLKLDERLDFNMPKLDLTSLQTLTFEHVDRVRFPCLKLAEQALAEGGAYPTVLNGANEIAVEAFLQKRISFGTIAALVSEALDTVTGFSQPDTIEEALYIDQKARHQAKEILKKNFLFIN